MGEGINSCGKCVASLLIATTKDEAWNNCSEKKKQECQLIQVKQDCEELNRMDEVFQKNIENIQFSPFVNQKSESFKWVN